MEVTEINNIAVVKALLASADLPTDDLDNPLINGERIFYGIEGEAEMAGLIGLELFDSCALLRSLVVSPGARGNGIGRSLVSHIERIITSRDVADVYLLTTTAEPYFSAHGFTRISREQAPAAIQNTTEFSKLCPDDAAFMIKKLL